DGDGNILWQQSFGGSESDELQALCLAPDGGYLLGGVSWSGVDGNKMSTNWGGADFWVIKVNTNGVKEWEASYGGSGTDVLSDMIPVYGGGYLLGGYSDSTNDTKTSGSFGGFDYWLVKIDSTGAVQWDKTFGGSNHDHLVSLHEFGNSTYYLCGYSLSGISGNKTTGNYGLRDLWAIRMDYKAIGVERQSPSQPAFPGDNVLLSVTMAGEPPFQYQWQYKGTNLPGQTRASLLLSSVTTNQSGTYLCRVTNQFGSTVTTNIVLNVQPLYLQALPPLANEPVRLRVRGPTGAPVVIESSPNLSHWTQQMSFTCNGGLQQFTNLPAWSGSVFYRVRSAP
ncbi:MAG: immunoglobulin domain-containing protein, partial [Limisphaerales bacterium]